MRAQEQARTALNEMVEYIRTARQPAPCAPYDEARGPGDSRSPTPTAWSVGPTPTGTPAHDLELVRFRVDSDPARTLYRDVSQTGDTTFVRVFQCAWWEMGEQ